MNKITTPYYECGKCKHEFKNYNSEGEDVWPSKCPKCGATEGRNGIHKVMRVDPIGIKFKSFIP